MATILNDKEKNLETTLTNSEYIEAVGLASDTEGSGAAAVKDTFVEKFGTAIDEYITDITDQVTAMQGDLDGVTNKGLYGDEIQGAISTLVQNLNTSLTEYAAAVQQAEKDIITEVESMFEGANESISNAMNTDSGLLQTGETAAPAGPPPQASES